jgi:hypothetical protein
VIGALLRYIVGRRLPLLIGSVIVTVLVLVSARVLSFEGFCALWALVLSVAVVMASIYETSDEDGPAVRDPRGGV